MCSFLRIISYYLNLFEVMKNLWAYNSRYPVVCARFVRSALHTQDATSKIEAHAQDCSATISNTSSCCVQTYSIKYHSEFPMKRDEKFSHDTICYYPVIKVSSLKSQYTIICLCDKISIMIICDPSFAYIIHESFPCCVTW